MKRNENDEKFFREHGDELKKILDEMGEILKKSGADMSGPMYTDFPAKKIAYYFSLISFNNLNKEEAFKLVNENSYEQLAKITNIDVESNINKSIKLIRKYFFKGFEVDNSFEQAINGIYTNGEIIPKDIETNFLKAVGERAEDEIEDYEELNNTIMQIIKDLHSDYVKNNVKSFKEENISDEELYNNLPFNFIGLERIGDLFICTSPILDKMGWDKGFFYEKPGAHLELIASLEDLYVFANNKILDKNDVYDKDSLKKLLIQSIKEDNLLNPENAPNGQKLLYKKRLKFMLNDDKLDMLVENIIEKNKYIDGRFFYNEMGVRF